MAEIHLIFYELQEEHVMQFVTAFVRKEKKKALTMEAIAPKWAKRLEQRNLPFPLSLTWLKWYYELDHPSKCVVGEAYGHCATYQKECKQCDALGWKFGGSFLLRSRVGMRKNIEEFVEHWNEKHTWL